MKVSSVSPVNFSPSSPLPDEDVGSCSPSFQELVQCDDFIVLPVVHFISDLPTTQRLGALGKGLGELNLFPLKGFFGLILENAWTIVLAISESWLRF